jgi:hypothetical protein
MERNEQKISKEIFGACFIELPLELWHHIIEYCPVLELLELRFVNMTFRSKATDLLRQNLKSFHLEIMANINSKIFPNYRRVLSSI